MSKIEEYNLYSIKPIDIIKNDFLLYKNGDESKYDWKSLENSIINNNYNPDKYSHIRLSKDYRLLDGNHRVIVLQNIFKNDVNKKILIKRSKFIYKTELLFIPPKLTIYLIYLLFKNIGRFFRYLL